jgi:hypothetical protein
MAVQLPAVMEEMVTVVMMDIPPDMTAAGEDGHMAAQSSVGTGAARDLKLAHL